MVRKFEKASRRHPAELSLSMAHQLDFVLPMECLHTDRLPEGPDWIYEVKLDGYRAQALFTVQATCLLSRNGKDLGRRFPGVIAALAPSLPAGSVADGELVALDAAGRPSFSLIQNSASSGARLCSSPLI